MYATEPPLRRVLNTSLRLATDPSRVDKAPTAVMAICMAAIGIDTPSAADEPESPIIVDSPLTAWR